MIVLSNYKLIWFEIINQMNGVMHYNDVLIRLLYPQRHPSPGFLRCKRWFLNHHAKTFAWWGNFFASLWLWQESLRNMFFEEKSLIFQEIIDLISGVDIIISAAWGQISACFKNLTPWFCSLEKPPSCLFFFPLLKFGLPRLLRPHKYDFHNWWQENNTKEHH